MRLLIVAASITGLSTPALSANCPLPQSWAKPERHFAARTPDMKFALRPGGVVRIGLRPQAQVRFAAGKARRKGYAGLAAIDVAKAGTLELGLDNSTYVDLVRHGKALPLAGEPRSHDCPGIRKTLDFKVSPGRYLVQFSGSPGRSVKLAISLR